MIRKLFLVTIILLFPHCSYLEKKEQERISKHTNHEHDALYSLDESASIIIELIRTKQLKKVLQKENIENLDLLIKNFSPAEMAFECEVLNFPGKAIAYYYQESDADYQAIEKILKQVAINYPDYKFVSINVNNLFHFVENSQIDTIPTIVIIENRNEIARLEKIKINDLEKELLALLQN